MIEITSKIVINPDMSLTFTAQTHGRLEIIDEARKLVKEFNSFCNLKVTRPYHPRSSGERSQNSHIWGHCTDLSMQAKSKEWTPAAVHQLMKALAVKEGKDYPHITYRGIMIYASDAEINSLQANNLIEMIHQFADQNNFWLTEYSDETPPRAYKSKGGRSLSEMLEKYLELNQELREQAEPEMGKQGQAQTREPQESNPEPDKIDLDANIEHVWFHPESGAICRSVSDSDEYANICNSDGMLVNLGEFKATPELRASIFKAVENGADEKQAAAIFDELGWNGQDIMNEIF